MLKIQTLCKLQLLSKKYWGTSNNHVTLIKDYNAREALDIQLVAVIVVITVVILIWCDWLSYWVYMS